MEKKNCGKNIISLRFGINCYQPLKKKCENPRRYRVSRVFIWFLLELAEIDLIVLTKLACIIIFGLSLRIGGSRSIGGLQP